MKRILLAALLLVPMAASAQQPPVLPVPPVPPKKPDLALIPRDVLSGIIQQANAFGTLHPELLTPSVMAAFTALGACMNDNPVNGFTQKTGEDQCPAVTTEIEARTKEIADLHAKITELQGKLDKLDAAGKTVSVKP